MGYEGTHIGVGDHEGHRLAIVGEDALQDGGGLGRTAELQGLGGVFRLKLKTTMMNEIADLMEERRKQQALLDETVIRAGYRNVASFLKAYEKAKKAVTEYKEYKKQHPGTRNASGDPGRESVLKKLAEYEKEGKRKQAERTASQDSQWQLRKPAAFVDGMENELLK